MKAFRLALVFWCGLAAMSLLGDTNLLSPDEIPPLRPPLTELPPSFWEQYGAWPVAAGALVLLLAGTGIWFLLRPKAGPPVAPVVQAHQALEPLFKQGETGPVLTFISQVFRRYFAAAFGLPAEELTTAEFCQALAGSPIIDSALSKRVREFLRQCDERKFAPVLPQPPLGAARTAVRLIDEAEVKRLAGAQATAKSQPPRLETSTSSAPAG